MKIKNLVRLLSYGTLSFFILGSSFHPSEAALPPLLEKIEKKYLKEKTLEAHFTQSQWVAMTAVNKKTSGVITIEIPGKFRWETIKPDKNLLVTDGKKFWFYTPPFEKGDRGQVVIKNSTEVQSELASILLTGAFSKVKNLKINPLKENVFQLIPEKGTAGTVQKAEIEIDSKKLTIKKIHLEHQGGNKVDIELNQIQFGQKYDSAFFRFVTPSDTDVITE